MNKSIQNYEYTDEFESVDEIHEILKSKKYDDILDHIKDLKKEIKKNSLPT